MEKGIFQVIVFIVHISRLVLKHSSLSLIKLMKYILGLKIAVICGCTKSFFLKKIQLKSNFNQFQIIYEDKLFYTQQISTMLQSSYCMHQKVFFFLTVPNRLLYNLFDESFDSHIQIQIRFKWHSSRFENYFKDNSQKYEKGNTFYRKEKKALAAFPLLFYFAFLISQDN